MSFDKITQLAWIYDLYNFSREAVLLENSNPVYQRILEHIVAGFDARSGSLALCSEDGNILTIRAGIDLPDGVIGSHIKIGEGILGWVAQAGVALLLNNDVSTDERFQPKREYQKSMQDNSAICWPLKMEGKVIGALSVNRPQAVGTFTEDDMHQGEGLLGMVSLALANIQLHVEQKQRIEELRQVNQKLQDAQTQLLHSEKMASIGQLAAGVAHEINNPIGYVYSNLSALEKYVQDVFSIVDFYMKAEDKISDSAARSQLQDFREKLDFGFLKTDLPSLMEESKEGITRVKKIVQALKDFSHNAAREEWHIANLHKGINSTLNIVNNEIKYKADVVKQYGEIPEIECLSSQLNQVFMNLMVNAAHAIEGRGVITISSGMEGERVWVEVADNGKGIPSENLKRIFEPFFTTKPVGKGTGLGLSLSYGIIQKHNGRIEVQSEVGKGTRFRVWLPIRHVEVAENEV